MVALAPLAARRLAVYVKNLLAVDVNSRSSLVVTFATGVGERGVGRGRRWRHVVVVRGCLRRNGLSTRVFEVLGLVTVMVVVRLGAVLDLVHLLFAAVAADTVVDVSLTHCGGW